MMHAQGLRIPLVLFGHMHSQLKGEGKTGMSCAGWYLGLCWQLLRTNWGGQTREDKLGRTNWGGQSCAASGCCRSNNVASPVALATAEDKLGRTNWGGQTGEHKLVRTKLRCLCLLPPHCFHPCSCRTSYAGQDIATGRIAPQSPCTSTLLGQTRMTLLTAASLLFLLLCRARPPQHGRS